MTLDEIGSGFGCPVLIHHHWSLLLGLRMRNEVAFVQPKILIL